MKSKIAEHVKQKAEQNWLRSSIKQTYTQLDNITIELYNTQLQLSKYFHHLEYTAIVKKTKELNEKEISQKRKIIKKKLKTLSQKQNKERENKNKTYKTNHHFYPRVYNNTNINFNQNEMEMLEKGLKHNITPQQTKNEHIKQMLNIESAITQTSEEDQNIIRNTIINQIQNSSHNFTKITQEQKQQNLTINNIKRKINEESAIVTKADKGNTVVIMKKEEYNNKVVEYITHNDIEEMTHDPTAIYLKEINTLINESKHVIKQQQKYHLKMIKPSAPKFTAQIKVHKDNKIRPLVNFTSAPSYKLAKYTNDWITKRIKMKENYSIKNTTELINKIENIEIPNNAKLASFDLTNMYGNIPVGEAIEATRQILTESDATNDEINEIIKIIKTITRQNYFQYSGKTYTQTDGLAMGNPLSGTIADIFINYYETKHIFHNNNKHKNKIIYWHRYVDDIIVLFNGTKRQLTQLHNYINNIHPKLQFTIEIEIDDNINFLDLSIKKLENKHNFNIFRKSTHTDHTINNSSNHPINHKYAAYTHMINRLNNTPMHSKNYENEVNTIKVIAQNNGFNPTMIDRMNKKTKNKIRRSMMTTLIGNSTTTTKYIPLEYNHPYSKIVKTTFKQYGYTISFKTNNKLQQKLAEKKTETEETGVYKLTCDDCTKFYIGQTGRNFKTRFAEHIKEIKKPTSTIKSNYALHIKNENHTFTNYDHNLSILHKINKSKKMDRLEEIEIYKNKNDDDLLNDKIKNNRLYDYIINI